MPSIHRIVLYRLLAAWVVISLMIGVVVSWAGLRKIEAVHGFPTVDKRADVGADGTRL